MYADLGPGQAIELDDSPPLDVELLYSAEYVAKRTRHRASVGGENTRNRRASRSRRNLGALGYTNSYSYVQNNPATWIDPIGLAPIAPGGEAVPILGAYPNFWTPGLFLNAPDAAPWPEIAISPREPIDLSKFSGPSLCEQIRTSPSIIQFPASSSAQGGYQLPNLPIGEVPNMSGYYGPTLYSGPYGDVGAGLRPPSVQLNGLNTPNIDYSPLLNPAIGGNINLHPDRQPPSEGKSH